MPALDEERLATAERIRSSLGLENELSRPQARAYVRCLQTTWRIPPIIWREKESQKQLDDARRLLHAAHLFENGNQHYTQAIDCYRRAGELLEWLSRSNDNIKSVVPIELLSAAAYQLGGLPAMAAGLLRQLDTKWKGVALYAAFLRADFDLVLQHSARFWSDYPELTQPDAAPHYALNAELSGLECSGVMWAFTAELVRCLGLIADSLRRGDNERLTRALRKLRTMDEMSARTLSDDTSLLISLMTRVAEKFSSASIYKPLMALSELRPDKVDILRSYARDQFSRGRGILWVSQIQGLDRLLKESSFALCTPTGSGKTLVANLALVKELLLREREGFFGGLALYVVPSRALAGEVEAKLASELGREIIVTGLYGGSDWGITDYWLTSEKPVVLIVTVEKAEALMRYLAQLIFNRLSLLIIDEAHQVVPDTDEAAKVTFSDHSNRSIRLEALVSRIIAARPEVIRIALTAVAGGASQPVARWIERRQDATAVGVRYRSTRQVIGTLDTTPNAAPQILVDLMNSKNLSLKDGIEPVYIPLKMGPMPTLIPQWRDSLNRFNSLAVLWAALHLAKESQRILISVAQEPEKTMRWFKEALELAEWQSVSQYAALESDDITHFEVAKASCRDYCGSESFEFFLLERRIATNHGQMPQRLRRLMVEMIDRKICPITVATATLTEGVNLPFDLILLTSLKRRSWDAVKEEQVVKPLSTSEFRNLAGRAGRPGTARGIEGMTLVALPTKISTTATAKKRAQRRQRQELITDYNRLRSSLLLEEQDAPVVASPLALLLERIWERAHTVLGITADSFLNWLEVTAPNNISSHAGEGASSDRARLADTVDELDAILLTSIEEVTSSGSGATLTRQEVEAYLVRFWQSTFTSAAAVQEAWLEQAFVRRGAGIVETIYPEEAERRQLYQYGLSPAIGRRFQAVVPAIQKLLQETIGYGANSLEERINHFIEIGDLIKDDRGYGFRIRSTATDTKILANWTKVLSWWFDDESIEDPEADELRSWQRFITDNLEFRLGGAIGAVVARAWSDGSADGLSIPSLADWKTTTKLPWFAFWARELLRWGTHDPMIAFSLSQGLAHTRESARAQRTAFDTWLKSRRSAVTPEDYIDPQLFLKWQSTLPKREKVISRNNQVPATLTGTNGKRGTYYVMPVSRGTKVHWLDASGFELGISPQDKIIDSDAIRGDFELKVQDGHATVTSKYRPYVRI